MSIHCPIFFDHAYKTPAIFSQTITIQTCCLCSSLFEPCHRHVPYLSYLKTCTTDNCYGGNDTCSSLEAYATECAKAGVCIDWRNATGGQCSKILYTYTCVCVRVCIYLCKCLFVCVFIVYSYTFLKYSQCILQSTRVQVTKCTWPVALLWSQHVMKGKVTQLYQT